MVSVRLLISIILPVAGSKTHENRYVDLREKLIVIGSRVDIGGIPKLFNFVPDFRVSYF